MKFGSARDGVRPEPVGDPASVSTGSAQTAAGTAEQALRRLEWTVLRRLDGLLQGDYRTLMRGVGLDLADLREYQSGDDVRHIDWNVTARLEVPHVRVYTEDREMSAWFLLDLSPSVDFGSGARSKREQLAGFVAVLARLLTRHGNRVGALLYNGGVQAVLPPGSGRRHVLQLLQKVQQASSDTDAPPGLTRLQDLLHSATALLRRRSTVFVLSDFISEEGWERQLTRLALRHEVVAVRLYDPLEQELPDLGILPMQDAETGELLMVDTHDTGFRARFAQLARQREEALRRGLARAGVDTLELATDDDLVDVLLRFTDMRRQRGRARSAPPPVHLRLVPNPSVEALS